MHLLGYQWAIREGEVAGNHTYKHERKFIDFTVSGQALSAIFQIKELDMISMLGWTNNAEYEIQTINEFLKQKPPDLATGRTIIYGCSECGDIGCGAITAEIIDADDKIIWKNFGYENNFEGFDLEEYKHIGPFEFEKAQYESEFEKIAADLSNAQRPNEEFQNPKLN